MQEDVAEHSKERRLARLPSQALAENGDRPIPVLTLRSDGGEASIDSLVAGEQRAGLGRQLFSDVVPLLGDGQFKVGEQHVGVFGGEFGSRFDCRCRFGEVATRLIPAGQRQPCLGVVWIGVCQVLQHDRCSFRRFQFLREQGCQEQRCISSGCPLFFSRLARNERLFLQIESHDAGHGGGRFLKLALAGERSGPQHFDAIEVEGLRIDGVGQRRRHLLAKNVEFSRGIAEPAEAEHPIRESLAEQEVIGVLADGGFEHGVGITAVDFGRGGPFGKLDDQAGELGLGFRVVRPVVEVPGKQPHGLRGVAFFLLGPREPRQGARVSGNLNPVDDGDGGHRGHGNGQHRQQHADIEAFLRAVHRMGGLDRRGGGEPRGSLRVYTATASLARLPFPRLLPGRPHRVAEPSKIWEQPGR